MIFSPYPFEPTNLCAVGMLEDALENEIRDMIRNLKNKYGLCVPAYMITEELEKRKIDYMRLPRYLKDEIDILEVY